MEPCWEYFHCVRDDCVMFGRTDAPCWTVDGTCCNNLAASYCQLGSAAAPKEDACARAHCIYYEGMQRLLIDLH